MHAHACHMSDFKAVSVVEWYNMHAHACHMPDFKAVSIVEWYNIHAHARLQGSESENSGVVQHACACLSNARLQGSEWSGTTYPPHARLQVSEVEWYNMLVSCQTSGQ